MEFNIDEIHDYLKTNWYDYSELNDFNMAIDSGYTDYAAYLIYIAGALNDDIPIEHTIKERLKNYDPKKDAEECFSNITLFVNRKTNEYAFIKNDYVDYLVELSDMGKDWYIEQVYSI